MKKKVIFVSQALWIGGIETALVNLINCMDYGKYDVTCLIIQDDTEMASRITEKCRIIIADRHRAVSFKEPYRYKRLYDIMEEPQNAGRLRRLVWKALKLIFRSAEMKLYSGYIKKQLAGEEFDTVIIYSDRTSEIAVRAVRGKKYLMFYHHGAMRREYHDIYGYRKSERIIAVSDSLRDRLAEYRPEFAGKMTAVNNIVNVQEIRDKSVPEPDVKFPEGGFNIVSCGRVSYEKGFDMALEACRILVSQGLGDIQWWIVGGGPEEKELVSRAEKLGISGHFHVLGMRSNPYPYIKKADLYVQPSRFEGHSLSVMEARILGCPIAATYNAAREQIQCGTTGMLCNAAPVDIADTVKYLYWHPEVRDGFRRALSEYDFEEENRRIMAQLEQLF